MKLNTLILVAAAGLVMASCGESAETVTTSDPVAVPDTPETPTAVTYTVDNAASSLVWEGEKLGQYKHSGTIAITSGSITAEGDKITAGDFAIDMKSMVNTDQPSEEDQAKLVGHLSSPDFFNVDSFPTSGFVITGCEANDTTMMVMGNLTIMGQERNITIPADITMEGDKVMAVAHFAIDRTQWGINYGSGLTGIVDNIISDEIWFDLNLVANK